VFTPNHQLQLATASHHDVVFIITPLSNIWRIGLYKSKKSTSVTLPHCWLRSECLLDRGRHVSIQYSGLQWWIHILSPVTMQLKRHHLRCDTSSKDSYRCPNSYIHAAPSVVLESTLHKLYRSKFCSGWFHGAETWLIYRGWPLQPQSPLLSRISIWTCWIFPW
jgi:hypothetical protein